MSEFQREREGERESEQLGILYCLDAISAAQSSDVNFFFLFHSFLFHSIPFFLILWSAIVGAGFILCVRTLFCCCCFVVLIKRKWKCYDFKRQRMATGIFSPFFRCQKCPMRLIFLSSVWRWNTPIISIYTVIVMVPPYKVLTPLQTGVALLNMKQL